MDSRQNCSYIFLLMIFMIIWMAERWWILFSLLDTSMNRETLILLRKPPRQVGA